MKKLYTCVALLVTLKSWSAIRYWDGGAGNGLWASAANWVGDVAPVAADDVVLDNLNGVTGTYTVTLPNTAVTVRTLTITPSGLNNITLVLPVGNIAEPGFQTTGSIFINNGGVFKNSSGAASTPTLVIGATTADSLYIYNGGTYEHNNQRSLSNNSPSPSTPILDKISTAPGTEYGRLHYNIPQSGSAGIAMQGRTFGSIEFSAGIAPSSLTYTSAGTTSGTPAILVRGDFKINSPAALSSTVIGGFVFRGNMSGTGNFTYNPTSSASVGTRSLFFSGTGNVQAINSTGTIALGAAFVKMEVSNGAVVSLQRNISAFGSGDSIVIKPGGTFIATAENSLSGTGSIFFNDTTSALKISSASGITASGATGNVQTDTRLFSKKAYYYYNGTAAQATGSGLPDSVYRLHLENPAHVTLSSAVCIRQVLALDSGCLKTTAAAMPKLAAGGAITSSIANVYGEVNVGNAGSFVSGPMQVETNATSNITVPVGRITGGTLTYAPVKLLPANATPKTYTVEYSDTGHVDRLNVESPPLDRVSRKEYWLIDCNLATSPDKDAKLGLSWRPNSQVGNGSPGDSATAVNDLVVAHYYDDGGGGGTRWRMATGGAGTFTPGPAGFTLSYGYITTDLNVGGFSPFTLGSRSAFNLLPVQLLQFAGQTAGAAVNLLWTVTDEKGMQGYELQQSTDGRNFSKIFFAAANNLTGLRNYRYTDANAIFGWNYYRLKMIDNQGFATYSATVKVWVAGGAKLLLYPNPAQKMLKIIVPGRSNSDISIVNSTGQVVRKVKAIEGVITIDIESLSRGVYYVYLQTNRQAIVQSFSKQ